MTYFSQYLDLSGDTGKKRETSVEIGLTRGVTV